MLNKLLGCSNKDKILLNNIIKLTYVQSLSKELCIFSSGTKKTHATILKAKARLKKNGGKKVRFTKTVNRKTEVVSQ